MCRKEISQIKDKRYSRICLRTTPHGLMQAAQTNAAPAPAAKHVPADELTDDLKWDFLRELVEEEFSRMQAQQPAPPQATHAKVLAHRPAAADPAAARDALSGASTQFSSPAGQLQDRTSPMVSPMHGPMDAIMAVPRLLPAPDLFAPAVSMLPDHGPSRFAVYAAEPLVYPDVPAGSWSVSC